MSDLGDIRPLDPSLAELLAELHRSGFDDPWSEVSFRDMLSDGRGKGIGLFADDNLLGFAILIPAFDMAEVGTIVTTPQKRGLGYGRRLLEALIEIARHDGFEKLLLEVAEDNDSARHIYNAAGFQVDGRRPRYYRRKDGSQKDAVLMSLRL